MVIEVIGKGRDLSRPDDIEIEQGKTEPDGNTEDPKNPGRDNKSITRGGSSGSTNQKRHEQLGDQEKNSKNHQSDKKGTGSPVGINGKKGR